MKQVIKDGIFEIKLSPHETRVMYQLTDSGNLYNEGASLGWKTSINTARKPVLA